jgi:hypothetical protein
LSIGFWNDFQAVFAVMPTNSRVREPVGDRIQKTAHRKTPKAVIFEPSAKHKQAINNTLVAYGYDHRGCVSADWQQLERSCGGAHSGLAYM